MKNDIVYAIVPSSTLIDRETAMKAAISGSKVSIIKESMLNDGFDLWHGVQMIKIGEFYKITQNYGKKVSCTVKSGVFAFLMAEDLAINM